MSIMTKPVKLNPEQIPVNRLAMVLDGKIIETINVDDRIAAILLSEPIFIDLGDFKGSIMENTVIGLNDGKIVDVAGNPHVIDGWEDIRLKYKERLSG